jgi:hypothetical protein
MYAVFMKTVQTDVGKSFVRGNEQKYDAQQIYKELLQHASTSTKAAIDSTAIMSYVTSVRLGDGKGVAPRTALFLNGSIRFASMKQLYPSLTISRTARNALCSRTPSHLWRTFVLSRHNRTSIRPILGRLSPSSSILRCLSPRLPRTTLCSPLVPTRRAPPSKCTPMTSSVHHLMISLSIAPSQISTPSKIYEINQASRGNNNKNQRKRIRTS